MSPEVLLEVRSISKSFPGVQALRGVDFELRRGEVHCLVGANGAGKSTLIKILSGIYPKDAGEVFYKGKRVEISSPREARKLGIATVFQELDVVPYLSIAENIFLGNYPRARWNIINHKEIFLKAQEVLGSLGEEIDVSLPAIEASAALRQLIVIGRALVLNAEIIIFDEPTAVLSVEEQQKLFRIIQELRKKGISVIYISHRLEEIIELGDRVTVLRDGMKVSTREIRETGLEQLIEDMVGRVRSIEVRQPLQELGDRRGEVVLSVRELCSDFTRPKLRSISFEVRRGEILGLFGFVGSGRTELAKCLMGCLSITSGEVYLEGRPFRPVSPWRTTSLGIAMAPEERKSQGLFLDLSVSLNVVLPSLRNLTKNGLIKWRRVKETSDLFVRELSIKTTSITRPVRYLSGGNQQKVVLARWFARNCKVLILDEPTRGVDVAGKREIIDLVKREAREGTSFIVISSEAEELLEICDKIAVMFRGRLMDVLDTKQCDVVELLRLASGLNPDKVVSLRS